MTRFVKKPDVFQTNGFALTTFEDTVSNFPAIAQATAPKATLSIEVANFIANDELNLFSDLVTVLKRSDYDAVTKTVKVSQTIASALDQSGGLYPQLAHMEAGAQIQRIRQRVNYVLKKKGENARWKGMRVMPLRTGEPPTTVA